MGTNAHGPSLQDVLPQPHILPPICQEVSDPPADGVGNVERREFIFGSRRLVGYSLEKYPIVQSNLSNSVQIKLMVSDWFNSVTNAQPDVRKVLRLS